MEDNEPGILMPPEPDVDELESAASILDVEVRRLHALRTAAMQIHSVTNYVRHVLEAVRTAPQRLRQAEQAERQGAETLRRLTETVRREEQRQTAQRETMRMQAEVDRSDTERLKQRLETEWAQVLADGTAQRQELEAQMAALTAQHEARLAQSDTAHAQRREALERDLTAITAIIADAGAHFGDRDRDTAAEEGRENA
jgi:hypothetical protein